MMGLSAFRRISDIFARLAVGQWGGGQPTNGRQDKSRGVRLGRSVEERGTDQRLGDEVPRPPQPAHPENLLKIITGQTSHGEWP
jgi:hypothetical protein